MPLFLLILHNTFMNNFFRALYPWHVSFWFVTGQSTGPSFTNLLTAMFLSWAWIPTGISFHLNIHNLLIFKVSYIFYPQYCCLDLAGYITDRLLIGWWVQLCHLKWNGPSPEGDHTLSIHFMTSCGKMIRNEAISSLKCGLTWPISIYPSL